MKSLFYKLLTLLLIATLALFTIGDLAVDFTEGESTAHLVIEGIALFTLLSCCIFFIFRYIKQRKTLLESPSRASLVWCLSSIGLLIVLTADDALTIFEGTVETSEYLEAVALENNLHEVVSGKFFRAGEMSHAEIRRVIDRYKIKTIIDLRYGDVVDRKGISEADIAAAENVRYEHVRLLSSKLPPSASVESLLDIYDRAESPVLVHCSGGAHRTSFASALWLLEKEGKSKEEAAAQFSPRYGFFRWERMVKSMVRGKPTLDTLIWRYIDDKLASVSFREWLHKNSAQIDLDASAATAIVPSEDR